MSWYNQGQLTHGTDQSGDGGHHHRSQGYYGHHHQTHLHSQHHQRQHMHHNSSGDVTRLEALDIIGELGRTERVEQQQIPQRHRRDKYQPVPLSEEPSKQERSCERSHGAGYRSSYSTSDGRETDPENCAPAPAAPAPRKRKRRSHSRGCGLGPPGRDLLQRGTLRSECTNYEAFNATEHRPYLRAEILRVFPSIGRVWTKNLKAGEKNRDDCEGYSRQGEDEAGGGDEEGGNELLGAPPPLLPEKDPLPFLPLFSAPSSHLDSLYDDIESALEYREETWTAVIEARANLIEARTRLKEAFSADASTKAALEVAKEAARAAELAEPCWWNDMLERMRAYISERGHGARLPYFGHLDRDGDADIYELARFDLSLKDRLRRGTLQRYPHRVKAVEELGFNWGCRVRDTFDVVVKDLRKHKEKYGHCDVREADDKVLFNRVGQVQKNYRVRMAGTKEYTARSWKKYNRHLASLRELLGGEEALEEFMRPRVRGRAGRRAEGMRVHRQKTGHCVHPDPDMRRWVAAIRERYHRRKEKGGRKIRAAREISNDLIDAMDHIHFCWTDRCVCEGAPADQDPPGNGAVEEGQVGKDEEEDRAEAPKASLSDDEHLSDDSFGLAVKMPEKEAKASENSWRAQIWNRRIKALRDYKAKHGHCDVHHKEDPKLYKWLIRTQSHYRKLKRFQEHNSRTGKCKEDDEDKEGNETDYNHTDAEQDKDGNGSHHTSEGFSLTEARARELEEVMGKDNICFSLSKKRAYFHKMFNQFKEYKDKKGNCRHPRPGVQSWLRKCRILRREQILGEQNDNPNNGGSERNVPEIEDGEASETEAKGRLKKKQKGRTGGTVRVLDPWMFDLLDEIGFCWGGICVCDDPEKKAALAASNWLGEGTEVRTQRSFDERVAAMKEHKEKTGHCFHPDVSMRLWYRRMKVRRRATLEKREQEKRGEEKDEDLGDRDGSGGSKDNSTAVVSVDKFDKGAKHPKEDRAKKPSTGGPLSDEQMAKLDAIGLCWVSRCKCLKSQSRVRNERNAACRAAWIQPRITNAEGSEMKERGGNGLAWIQPRITNAEGSEMKERDGNGLGDNDYDTSFDQMLSLFLSHRKLSGRCYSTTPVTQNWYQDVKRRYAKHVEGEVTLSDHQIASLLCSGICLQRGPCHCHRSEAGAVLQLSDVAPLLATPGTTAVPKSSAKGDSISKTVSELNPQELEKLSAEVVDYVRRVENWSLDEYSSDDDSSFGNDSMCSATKVDDSEMSEVE